MRSIVLLALVAELAAGCNNGLARPPTGTSLTGPQSFTVRGTLPADISTSDQDFVLRVDPKAGTMILGTPGVAVSVPLVSTDGVSFHAGAPVVLPISPWGCGSAATYSDFHFVAGKDSLSGTATGMALVRQGDTGFQSSTQLDFSGPSDTTAPSIPSIPVDAYPFDPLGALVFTASEPLPTATRARLASPRSKSR